MKLYFSTWMCPDQSYSLGEAKVTTRLTSFFFRDMADEENTLKYMQGETLPFKPQQAMEESDADKA